MYMYILAFSCSGYTLIYKILGVHGVIVTNALLFIYKIRYTPSLLPVSVPISDDAP